MEKSIFSKLTIAAIAALVLGACQGSDPLKRESNPVKSYKTVTDEAVGIHEQKQRDQAYATDLYVIDVNENGKSTLVFNFVEGVAKTYKLNIRTLVDKATFTAKLELAKEAEGKGITLNPNGSLSWTPAAKTIPMTDSSVTYKGKIVLVAATTDTKAQKLLANKDLSTPIEIKVSRQEATPTIKSIEGINDKTVYSAAVPFRVTVNDPAMSDVRDPMVRFVEPVGKLTDEQKNKKYQVISTQSFYATSATKLGGGSWTINYSFEPSIFVLECEKRNIDLSKLPETITVVSNVIVVSYGQMSPESSIAIQVKNPKAVKTASTQGDKK